MTGIAICWMNLLIPREYLVILRKEIISMAHMIPPVPKEYDEKSDEGAVCFLQAFFAGSVKKFVFLVKNGSFLVRIQI